MYIDYGGFIWGWEKGGAHRKWRREPSVPVPLYCIYNSALASGLQHHPKQYSSGPS